MKGRFFFKISNIRKIEIIHFVRVVIDFLLAPITVTFHTVILSAFLLCSDILNLNLAFDNFTRRH